MRRLRYGDGDEPGWLASANTIYPFTQDLPFDAAEGGSDGEAAAENRGENVDAGKRRFAVYAQSRIGDNFNCSAVNLIMGSNQNEKLAVLIDADNAQPSIIRELLAEVSRYGIASVKRAYGDWTTTNLKGWKDVLHEYGVQPMQQFSYTNGKNSTDSSLIIDAMDLLCSGRLDGFCLVSSDSDFTRLATRIRESGLMVYGFGEKKTPRPFVAACDKFIYTEILRPNEKPTAADEPAPDPIEPMLMDAVNASAREDGWSPLSTVGSYINKNNPSFDPRNYHCEKLGELVRKQSYLQVKEVSPREGSPNLLLYVRFKARS